MSLSRFRVLGLCLVLVTASAGCRTPATEVELFIDSDAPATRRIVLSVRSFAGIISPSELPMRAQQLGSVGETVLTREPEGLSTLTLGGSLGIVPVRAGNTDLVTLWLQARIAATVSAPEIVIDRVARVNFIRGARGRARVFLALSCGDRAVGCSSVSAAECTVSVRCREQNVTCGDQGQCVLPELHVLFPFVDAGSDVTTPLADADPGRIDEADVANETGVDASDTGSDVTCGARMEALGGRCVPIGAFPRPIVPLSLGDVSLRRPTLSWELPAQMDGVEIELCRDRECTMRLSTFSAMGTQTRPADPLPARAVVFWRMRGKVGNAVASTYSPTWLFHVPAMDNAGGIDTSANAHFDVNGDGLDDVLVGSPSASPGARMGAGVVSVFHGRAMGVSMIADRVLEGNTAGDAFGFSAAGAGDVNGDGYADLVIGAITASPGGRSTAGTATLFHGSAMGVAMLPRRVLEGTAAGDFFGISVASAGDVNHDGYGDLVIGASNASPGGRRRAGTASVFHGSASSIAMVPNRLFEGALTNDNFGTSVAGAGDLNGDGFGDLVIGAVNASPSGRMLAGAASVFYGSAMGVPMVADRVLEGAAAGDSLGIVASAGDVNGDGYSELLIGAPTADPGGRSNAGTVGVFHGGPMGVAMVADRLLEGTAPNDVFGSPPARAGDINGDGFGDLVIGAYLASPGGRISAGIASVFYGSRMGVPMVPVRVLEGTVAGDNFGRSVASAGDVNGDGYADLVVGADRASPGGRMQAGTASVFLGGVMGVAMVANQLLEGTSAGDGFGRPVARLELRRFRTLEIGFENVRASVHLCVR